MNAQKNVGLAKLAKGTRPIRARLLIDGSGSIRQQHLEEAMIAAVNSIQNGLKPFPSNRICRAIFDSEVRELDGFEFWHPAEVSPFGEGYEAIGSGTYLDEFTVKELNRLLARANAASGYIDVLLLVTDGKNNGPIHTARIREFTHRVLLNAARTGGLDNAAAAVWYWGIGLDTAHHFEQARDRYGLPIEWITWTDADVAEIEWTGRQIGEALGSMSSLGSGTIIPDRRRPS